MRTISEYLDSFDEIETTEELRKQLRERPDDIECELVHECLTDWKIIRILVAFPSVGICTNLTMGVPNCYMEPGEKTGIDSTMRRNRDRLENCVPNSSRKKMGIRGDLIWRKMTAPEKDWGIGEVARIWDKISNKYISESTFKLPRQLHDILIARTMEVGDAQALRNVLDHVFSESACVGVQVAKILQGFSDRKKQQLNPK
ncbi:hypothetical protein BGX27_004269 [Mortierella sp. AM989]|nr:hypothetical protein BGX27_004269 [Mortierella sp. AM989]